MPETITVPGPAQEIPSLLCPNCNANILADSGFYNYCSETVFLREDNYTSIINGHFYLDHDENGHETQDHECQVDARCSHCNELLPWPLYEIRGLDGCTLPEAANVIAGLLAQIASQTGDSITPAP
jgi:hypothetical protein